MKKMVVGFELNHREEWIAQLDCGHNQHVRHRPPWVNRPWINTPEGRTSYIGKALKCKKCDEGRPPDRPVLARTLSHD